MLGVQFSILYYVLQTLFATLLERLPESYRADANDTFNEIEDILGDVTTLNDLSDDEREGYDDLKEELREIIDEVKHTNKY